MLVGNSRKYMPSRASSVEGERASVYCRMCPLIPVR